MIVICRICKKSFEINQCNPQDLIMHYRQNHGCINYRTKKDSCCNTITRPIRSCCNQTLICPKSVLNSCNRTLFKKSVAKWRPGKKKLFCPLCCVAVTPLIKTEFQCNKSIFSSAFWSLCFFPCLFPKEQQENLYCSQCNSFLGTYDPCKHCVKPNF